MLYAGKIRKIFHENYLTPMTHIQFLLLPFVYQENFRFQGIGIIPAL
jgi:hypothetical protein